MTRTAILQRDLAVGEGVHYSEQSVYLILISKQLNYSLLYFKIYILQLKILYN